MSNVTRSLYSDHYLVTHDVGPQQTGIRLDSFLKERYRRRSRAQIQRAIAEGIITVKRNQGAHLRVGRLKPSSQLLSGDLVEVLTERRPEPEVNFNYSVLFEDENLLIINKPAHLPVHPAGRFFFNTLLVHLRTDGFKNPLKSERELFLVHRIDKETSGVLVLTKNRDVCIGLSEQFRERTTEKKYMAIVRGEMKEDHLTIDTPLKRDSESLVKLKMKVTAADDPEAQIARTEVYRKQVRGGFTWVECHPKTGRQHQIRVHLDSIGLPIVGDKLYGIEERDAVKFFDPEDRNPYGGSNLSGTTTSAGFRKGSQGIRRAIEEEDGEVIDTPELVIWQKIANRRFIPPELQSRLLMTRHALHASSIRFKHPFTGESLEFESPLPEDMRTFFESQKSI